MDIALKIVLFLCSHNLSVFVNHAPQCILLADLFDLVGEVLDFGSCCIHTLTKMLASTIFFLQKRPIFFHRLVLAVAFPEHFKGLRSVCQVLKTALDWLSHEGLGLLQLPIKTT